MADVTTGYNLKKYENELKNSLKLNLRETREVLYEIQVLTSFDVMGKEIEYDSECKI